jgi:DNA mismatch endonuclease, patch repair protein
MRFFKDYKPLADLRCTADLAFPKQRVCIFVDGCFWHGCRRHFIPPKTNAAWWLEKIRDNRVRDKRQKKKLMAHQWSVIRVWEHALQPGALEKTVNYIRSVLEHSGRSSYRPR